MHIATTVLFSLAFIVYAKEENDPNGDQVLCLSDLLNNCGIYCDIDLDHADENVMDWSAWVQQKLEICTTYQHNYVIVVYSSAMISTLEEENESADIEMVKANINCMTLKRYLQQGADNVLPLFINNPSPDYVPPSLAGKTCYDFPYDKLFEMPEDILAYQVLDHPDFVSLKNLVATVIGQQKSLFLDGQGK